MMISFTDILGSIIMTGNSFASNANEELNRRGNGFEGSGEGW